MQKIINDNLIKNSAVVAISNKISLLQRKIFNFLIAVAYVDLDKQESFTIEMKYLKFIVGFNSKNIHYLKEALKELLSTVVEFNILWKDKDAWSATTLLSSVEFSEWLCTYSFSPVLRKKLHQPNIYAKIKLSMMKLFTSKYSLCLYEIFIDYHNIGQTPVIPLDDFRKLMWIEKHQYTEFKRLSLRVIKPAVNELSSIWWYRVEVTYQKQNRKVTALKFHFTEIAKPKKPMQEMKVFNNLDLQDRLVKEFELSIKQAQKTIKTYPIPYIKESLTIIKHKISQKVVKNIPAYTVTVLKNDYTTISNKQKISILPSSKRDEWHWKTYWDWLENIKSSTGLNILHNADNHNVSKTQKKAKKYFESLSKKGQQALVRKFEDEKITSDIIKTVYKKEGIDGTLMKVMFENYISIQNK